MSPLAEILLKMGHRVSGSDQKPGAVTERLVDLGATIFSGHQAGNLSESLTTLVYSSAISSDNEELVHARTRGIPVVKRAEILADLMRLKFGIGVAGSHGKTTTTSMIGAILTSAALDPTVVVGGIIKGQGSGGRFGSGQFLVAEADESDRSFLCLQPTIAVVTNIDHEHMNAYESFEDLKGSFHRYVSAVPFYGLGVFCSEDAHCLELSESFNGRKVTYGFGGNVDYAATNLQASRAGYSFEVLSRRGTLGEIQLPLIGRHFVLNSLAAIAVGLECEVPFERIQLALKNFTGVKRRLEVIGEERGVTVINDYAHHPTEIRAALSAVRDSWGQDINKLRVFFEPHRYSRTRDSFEDFANSFGAADEVVISEIYGAGESALEGVSAEKLVHKMVHPSVRYSVTPDDALPAVVEKCEAGDVVLCLGAGNIGVLPEKILLSLRVTTHGGRIKMR